MRAHYDFDKMKGWRKNPYAKLLKKSITIRLDREAIAYFKAMASQTGVGYQLLINFYLSDCALHHRKLKFSWTK